MQTLPSGPGRSPGWRIRESGHEAVETGQKRNKVNKHTIWSDGVVDRDLAVGGLIDQCLLNTYIRCHPESLADVILAVEVMEKGL